MNPWGLGRQGLCPGLAGPVSWGRHTVRAALLQSCTRYCFEQSLRPGGYLHLSSRRWVPPVPQKLQGRWGESLPNILTQWIAE